MRVKVTADNPLEWMGLVSGMVPVPLVEAFMGMGQCRVLLTACKLGVFDALGDGEMTGDELAEALGTHPDGTRTLMSACNGFGYVKRRAGRFRNSAAANKWLRRDSPKTMLDTMLFTADLWERMSDLDEAVRTGGLPRFHDGMPPEVWGRYVRGLASFARVQNS